MTFPLYAVVGAPVIFVLGLIGTLVPTLVSFFFPSYGITRRVYYSFFNGLAAGLVLAVGFVHSIPGSFQSYSTAMGHSRASEMTKGYAWPAWIAMMGVIICFAVEEFVEFLSSHFGVAHAHAHGSEHSVLVLEDEEHERLHTLNRESASRGLTVDEFVGATRSPTNDLEITYKIDSKIDLEEGLKHKSDQSHGTATRRTVKMLVLFFGLLFHNVFVGLALGAAENDQALLVAITFHQFFEGFGLGARVADAKLRQIVSVLVLDLVFAAAAPVGIGIGLGVKSALADGSMAYSLVDGTFQALSGGILVYVALTHMFRAYHDTQANSTMLHWHRLASFVGILLGAGVMSVIGIWT